MYPRSQEIKGHALAVRGLTLSGRGLEDLEVLLQVFVELHNRGEVAATVSIVRGGPDSHQLLVEHVFVTLHGQLMGTGHQVQSVIVAELLHRVPAEEISRPTGRNGPPLDHLRIRPQQVAHGALLRDFPEPVDLLEVVDFLDVGREAAMHAEDLIVDNSSDGEVVEDLSEGAPDVERSVLADALVVEAIDLRDEAGLVVAAQERDPVLVAHLECQQHEEGLDAVASAVDVIAQEDIVGVGRVAADLEELQQVVELPMDVSADRDW